MATDGTSAGGMFFDVGANLDPLRKDLEQMKAEAAKAGEEAGKAAAQGVAQGVASQGGVVGPGIGGGVGGVGGGIAGPGMGGGVAAGGVPITPPAGGGSSGGGATAGGTATAAATPAGGLNTGAINGAAIGVLINQMVAVAEKFERIGEIIGTGLFENTRKLAELDTAISYWGRSIDRMTNSNDTRFANATKGSTIDKEAQDLADVAVSKAKEATEKYIKHDANRGIGDVISLFAEEATNYGLGNMYTSGLTQEKKVAEGLQRDANAATDRAAKIAASRNRFRMGNIVADLDDAAGIEYAPSLRTAGPGMSGADIEALKMSAGGDREYLMILTRTLQSFQGQQEYKKEILRGVTTQQGGD